MRTHACRLAIGALAGASFAHVASADVVIDWNNAWLQAIRATGGPPCPIARNGAIVHVAMYDALNCVERTHEPYLMFNDVPPSTSKEAAIAMAAYTTLSSIYGNVPALRTMFDGLRDSQLALIPNGPDKTAGIDLGVSCANGIMASRANDGSNNNTPYVIGGHVGDWQPTYPDFTQQPASPNWPLVTPWTMVTGSQFRPVGPCGFSSMSALLASECYAWMFNDVKEIGALNSATRTAEQTLIARFWANDRNGTYKPPGHLCYIAQVVAANNKNTLSQNAQLFALLTLGMADAGIVAWDAKYSTDIDFWRPITGIRLASVDGNPATVQDRVWEPLSDDPQVNGFTPPFPAWISGHATFGALHAAVLEKFYRTDRMKFTIGSDDVPGTFRTYSSFSSAALENGRSRIYLGVHWQFDADDAYAAGTSLGHFVVGNYLRRIGDTDGNCYINVDDLLNVVNAWGPCPPANVATCPADVAPPGGDGFINVDDLLAVINHWGPCPN